MEQLLPMNKKFCLQEDGIDDLPFRVVEWITEEYVLGGKPVEMEVLYSMQPTLKFVPKFFRVVARVEEV